MSTRLTAASLIPLSVQERKQLILDHISFIDATEITDKKLQPAYKYGRIISLIAPDYFRYQLENNNLSCLELEQQSKLIENKTKKFTSDFINWLKVDFKNKSTILDQHPNPKNLFELCGAKLLVTSNSVTRSLSTKMGRLWEEIADISPYVIIPEFEFQIKIKGIDIIILSDNKVHFAQLKTLKGTLTGSQKDRAKKELSIHDNPLFVTAFDLGDWTFNDDEIKRMAGKEFWDKIHIEYDLVEHHVRNMLQKIDKAFTDLAAGS